MCGLNSVLSISLEAVCADLTSDVWISGSRMCGFNSFLSISLEAVCVDLILDVWISGSRMCGFDPGFTFNLYGSRMCGSPFGFLNCSTSQLCVDFASKIFLLRAHDMDPAAQTPSTLAATPGGGQYPSDPTLSHCPALSPF